MLNIYSLSLLNVYNVVYVHLRIEIPFVDTSVSGYLKKNKQGRINDGYDIGVFHEV